jgi:hypothetical protein
LSDLARARNYLVPFHYAYYLPRFKGKAILPDGWKAPVKEEAGERIFITPALPLVPYFESSTQGSGQGTSAFHENSSAITDRDLRAKIEAITETPLLTFARVRISKENVRIFGSVNPSEIAVAFREQRDISIPKEYISGRLKEIGLHQIQIAFSDAEPLIVDIEVKDLSFYFTEMHWL